MISLQTRVRGSGEKFRRLALETAPTARKRLASDLRRAALSETIATTPVRTGRARRGWQSAIDDSAAEGEGSSESSDEFGTSRRSATNHVPYVQYLEYGTSRMAPREIVQRALRRVAALAAGLFSLSGGAQQRSNDDFNGSGSSSR